MSKKICLLVDCLSHGGAEKVAANLSLSLSKKGYNVFIVSMRDSIAYNFSGTLYNFGKIKAKYTKLKAFFEFKNFFAQQSFDVIIDHRVRNVYLKEVLFSKYVFRKERIIYCLHNYNLFYSFSFLKVPFLALFPHVKRRRFISVCKEIQRHLNKRLSIKSRVIYNFISSNIDSFKPQKPSFDKTYIIGVGRLTKVKQFDELLKSYNSSKLPENNIELIILGDGEERIALEALINKLNLSNLVKLIPFTNNPYNLISNAKALVLSSKVEGFPMVLLEALSLNTPVVSYNCKSGPNEIIRHNENGLLVENQNQLELTMALNKLILDQDFYKAIKKNTQIGLEKFSEVHISQQWFSLLENQI
ncbi:MAG: glycosyltransferase [Flaviramulus sp.]|nr:glycosyltransferase [Flaviramulus sp.]NNC51084.1 glycosyltransferase [Flaviramulus sp.]